MLFSCNYIVVIGLSYIERPIVGDHLKAHKFGFCDFHEKRVVFVKSVAVFMKSIAVFVKSVAVFVKSIAVFVKSAAF